MGDYFDDKMWEMDTDWDADDDGNNEGGLGGGQDGDIPSFVASHVVALIDCHPDMFQNVVSVAPKPSTSSSSSSSTATGMNGSKNGTTTKSSLSSPFEMSLFTIETYMENIIEDTVIRKTGKRNGVGAVLYNTKPTRPSSAAKGSSSSSSPSTAAGTATNKGRDQTSRNKNNDGDGKSNNNNNDDHDDDDDDNKSEGSEKMDTNDDDDDEIPTQWMVHELINLKPPGISTVQKIQSLQQSRRSSTSGKSDRNLQDEYCPTSKQATIQERSPMTPLQNAIETAMRMFQNAHCVRDPNKVPSRGGNSKNKSNVIDRDLCSIWIFTNRELPYTNPNGIELVVNATKEAAGEMGIKIIVWPFPNNVPKMNITTNNLPVGYEQITNNSNNNNNSDNDGNNVKKIPFDSDFYQSLYPENAELRFEDRFADRDSLEEALFDEQVDTRKNRKTYTTPFHILEERMAEPPRNNTAAGTNDVPPSNPARSVQQPPIMVDWYSITRELKRPGKTKIDAETKKKVKRTRIWTMKETGEEVRFNESTTVDEKERQNAMPMKKLIRKFYQFVNESVPMGPNDTNQMRSMGCRLKNPGLLVMGFKPSDSIPFYHRVKQSFLIYPTDVGSQGSVDAFARLHASMLRKNVIAVGQYWLRQGWEWRYCAVRPLPPSPDGPLNGMMVYPLPFRDDMRRIDDDATSREIEAIKQGCSTATPSQPPMMATVDSSSLNPTVAVKEETGIIGETGNVTNGNDDGSKGNIATEDLVNATLNLMSKMNLEDEGEDGVNLGNGLLTNPALQDFFDYLSSIAFGARCRKITNHLLRPTAEEKAVLNKKVNIAVEDFLAKLPTDAEKVKDSKRRSKPLVPDNTGLDWYDLLKNDRLKSCKIDQLKAYLRSVGEPVGGRKDELLSRVTTHLQSRPQQQHAQKRIKTENDGTSMEV